MTHPHKHSTDELLRSELDFEKNWLDKVAKNLTSRLGSVWFLTAMLLFVSCWVAINTNTLPGVNAFDPYPFELLVIMAALFVVFMPIVVLISQNRQEKIAEIRQHIDLEINVRAEHEITKILHMLHDLHTELGMDKEDVELERMKTRTNITEIKEKVEKGIDVAAS